MSGGVRRQSHEGADRLSLSDGLLCQIARKIKNRRMRNRTYGGVRGRKTKVGEKLLRFPPTRLGLLHGDAFCSMSRRTDFYIAM